ncbi:DoxX family protein [Acetobacter fallax]|uniref:DoxX family membrane protein n=1 Tax=Acetobacter fallax TaxID=1737473 RepID=A0ABX0KEV3_9PROT|nr:DoxX family protein [Acetobacter fallax]NHO34122.1 DoxX family membrane protein [Acetobacter fallax]NHO37666.1 DoxX family membrane protein [Acetobacter fallax]
MLLKRNILPSSFVALHPRFVPGWLLWLALVACCSAMFYSSFIATVIPDFARFSTIGLDGLSLLIVVLIMPRYFVVGFLGSMLPFLISWRVAAIHGSVPGMASSTIAFLIYLLLYVDCVAHDWKGSRESEWGGHLQWQIATIRIYFGFDMVGHFAEKLFSGQHSFNHMAQLFIGFGLPSGGQAVIVAGLCELAISIGVGMGVLTRAAGIGGAIYYLIANQYGHHFGDGFTWNNAPVGGWEYPMLMIVLFASFSIAGAGKFSIDGWMIAHGLMPRFLLSLCVSSKPDYAREDS